MMTTEHTALPTEPSAFTLRRAAQDLASTRDALNYEIRLLPADQTRGHHHRITEIEAVIEWLDYRADMREVW